MNYKYSTPNLHILMTTRMIDSSENIGPGYDKLILSKTYTDACLAVGVMPHLTPVIPKEFAPFALEGMDGLIISGGSDVDPSMYKRDPKGAADTILEMDESDLALMQEAKKHGVPTLGICRGMQMLNVMCGGTLKQHISNVYKQHPSVPKSRYLRRQYRHMVTADRESWVFKAHGERFETNSIHHQAIGKLGKGLKVVARADDGIIESVEYKSKADNWTAVGVQWHPEQLPNSQDFFSAWLNTVMEIKESSPPQRRSDDQ